MVGLRLTFSDVSHSLQVLSQRLVIWLYIGAPVHVRHEFGEMVLRVALSVESSVGASAKSSGFGVAVMCG